jgi:hypothetical protein
MAATLLPAGGVVLLPASWGALPDIYIALQHLSDKIRLRFAA